jgi:hypothetical protein
MLHVFDDCAHENYQRTPVIHEDDNEHSLAVVKRKVAINQRAEGQIIESDEDIIAENVPIITPNSDIIVESLSLKVKFINQLQHFNVHFFYLDHTSYACSYYGT